MLALGRLLWDRNPKQDFSTPFGGFFSRGRFKMSPAVSMSYWSIFQRSLVGLADFACSKFQWMANWPSFDFFNRNWVNCTNLRGGIGRFCGLEFQRMANWPRFDCRFCRLEVPTDGQLAQFRFFYRNWASWPSVGIRVCKIGQSL